LFENSQEKAGKQVAIIQQPNSTNLFEKFHGSVLRFGCWLFTFLHLLHWREFHHKIL
jgi:hypothetical protein